MLSLVIFSNVCGSTASAVPSQLLPTHRTERIVSAPALGAAIAAAASAPASAPSRRLPEIRRLCAFTRSPPMPAIGGPHGADRSPDRTRASASERQADGGSTRLED